MKPEHTNFAPTQTETKPCLACESTGRMIPEGCEMCDSNGWLDDPSDGGTMTCPECDGEAGETCPECDGFGEIDC